MIQNLSPRFVSTELLQTVFGQSLTEREWNQLRQMITILEPPARKRFWQVEDGLPGLYIITSGKVRLTDDNDNLVTSLTTGESFGELTLFLKTGFQPYSIRSTQNPPTVCRIPSQFLQGFINKYPKIRQHFYDRAVLLNSQLQGSDAAPLPPILGETDDSKSPNVGGFRGPDQNNTQSIQTSAPQPPILGEKDDLKSPNVGRFRGPDHNNTQSIQTSAPQPPILGETDDSKSPNVGGFRGPDQNNTQSIQTSAPQPPILGEKDDLKSPNVGRFRGPDQNNTQSIQTSAPLPPILGETDDSKSPNVGGFRGPDQNNTQSIQTSAPLPPILGETDDSKSPNVGGFRGPDQNNTQSIQTSAPLPPILGETDDSKSPINQSPPPPTPQFWGNQRMLRGLKDGDLGGRRFRRLNQTYFPHPTQRVGHWFQRIIRRYPFFAQQSASDCGAACLVMVARYWGKQLSLNRLRDIANVDRNGTSLKGLSTAAESIGFSTRPVKASLKQLGKQRLPAIVHWQGNHYIVVYAVTPKQVIVADPALGQKTLSHQEFKRDWTGYALLLQPTILLKDSRDVPWNVSTGFWQFFELIKPHGLVLLEVFIASLVIQIFGLVTPILTQLILDRVVVQRSELTLMAVGFGLLIFSLFRVAMTGLRQYLLDHTANKVDLALVVGFIRHTLRLPLSFFESRYVGDILSRVQENSKIQRFLTGEALSIILDLMMVFIYGGLMFWYSWKLAFLVLAIVPPFFLLALIATPFLRRISREIFNAGAKENSYLIEALSGIRTVKSTAIEQTVRWHWEELLNQEIKKRFSGQVIGNRLQIFSNTIEALATTGLLWFGAWLVIQNQLTIGQLVAFNMLLGNVIQPFQRLAMLWDELQEVAIAIERINDVLDYEPEEDLQQQVRQILPQLSGHIRFEQVTFRYHPESETNVLENLTFEIKPGQMVALVGRSGSGKTTIAKLILGLYPPTQGRVFVDGYEMTSLSLRSLRQQIGVVDQDTFLFGGTIHENISLSNPSTRLEDVITAAQLAGADEFIQKLPMGYETQIGEAGGMLSGGQRQRLAIARALLGNPRLLILDEATSHLDAESERIIQTNLNSILKDRTTLVIAHRLSTVRQADLILVLDRGVLIEQGTHTELMAKRGHYFYLNQQQLSVSE